MKKETETINNPQEVETPDEKYIRNYVSAKHTNKEEGHNDRKIAIIKTAQDMLNRYKIGVEPDREYLEDLINLSEQKVLLTHGIMTYQKDKNPQKFGRMAEEFRKNHEAEENWDIQFAVAELLKRQRNKENNPSQDNK